MFIMNLAFLLVLAKLSLLKASSVPPVEEIRQVSQRINATKPSLQRKAQPTCLDQRFIVRIASSLKEPFRSVVRITLSSGRCSGVLIGPKHVLTSAHCIHNRTAFTSSPNVLEVGIVQYVSNQRVYATYQVDTTVVSRKYLTGAHKNAKHDYALLTLTREHGRQYLRMKAMSNKALRNLLHKTIHFASFPLDKPAKQMWYTSCTKLKPKPDVIISKCFAKSGSSGAGVYVLKGSPTNRFVVGVLSGVRGNACTTVATRLTNSKIKEICGWIGNKQNCP